jgi:hypothetical protein
MSGSLGIGTSSPVTALEISPSISNSSIKTGGIEIQSYAVNNGWIADNMYYSGSWKARATGHSTNVYFGAGTINFTRAASTGSGATIFPTSSMFIDTSGNVGIGTTAPNYTLHIDSNTTLTRFQITNSTTGQGGGVGLQIIQNGLDAIITNRSNGYLGLETNSTERMRITSAGNVGIGTSSPICNLDVVGAIYAGYFNLRLADTTAMAANVGGGIALSGRYTTAGDTTDFGFIKGMKENGTSGDYGGYINFYTRPAAGNFAERMRIRSEGNIRIGTSTANPTELLEVNSSSGGSATHYTLFLYNTRSGGQSSGDHYVRFFSNTTNGSIRANGSGGIDYNTTSDSRLKLDPKDFNAISIINKMKPKNFKWKDYNITSEGFYAQELYDVYPQAVSVGND